MKSLLIDSTKSTPSIGFDPATLTLHIKGESYPENTSEFYAPVFAWLDEALAALGDRTMTVNVDLIYFNSSSSKILMDLFFKLDQAAGDGRTITVNWIYETDTEESLEYGEEFQEDVEHMTFNLVPKES